MAMSSDMAASFAPTPAASDNATQGILNFCLQKVVCFLTAVQLWRVIGLQGYVSLYVCYLMQIFRVKVTGTLEG
jgi:hypothetical protein